MCRIVSSLAIALTVSINPFLWGQDTAQEIAVAEENKSVRKPDVIFVPTPQDVVDKMLAEGKIVELKHNGGKFDFRKLPNVRRETG